MSITSVIRYVQVDDSITGAGKTGLAYSDFTAKYLTEGGTLTSLTTETITTLGTYQAPTSSSHIRIKEVSSSDPAKGLYEVHFHNTQVASSGSNLWLMLSASGARIAPLWIPLYDVPGRIPTALSGGYMPSDSKAINGVSTSGVTTVSPYVGSTGAAVNGTNVNILAGHDPGEAIMGVTDLDATLTTIAGYIDTEVAAIKMKTDNLPSDPADASDIAASFVKIRKYLQLLARKDAAIATDNATELAELNANGGSGAGGFANTSDALESIRDRGDAAWITGSSGSGSGARTVTITVNDGSTVLENAKVRMTNGAESYVVATNASGVAVFSLDDATWSVAITKAGYQFTPTTLVVSGTTSHTYSMTLVTITPSDPNLVTGVWTAFSAPGSASPAVDTFIRMVSPPPGSGLALSGEARQGSSGANGIVQFTNLFPGATYELWRGSSNANSVLIAIPVNAVSPVDLTNVIGSP